MKNGDRVLTASTLVFQKIKRDAGIYFLVQGIAVIFWWILLVYAPFTRKHFGGVGAYEITLLAFWLPDLLIVAIGSIAAAVLCFVSHKTASQASWFATGAVSYASLYCLSFSLLTDLGWLGVALMLPSMLWSGVFTFGISSFNKRIFRQAKPANSTNWILAKTLLQIIVVWGLILFVIPPFIVALEDKLAIARLDFSSQKLLAAVLFVGISLLGLSSAYTMSKIGRGTPLPLDAASRLVVVGAYRYVRNPMAISGIGQGLAVALYHGSSFVAVYALMGGAIWQLVFRRLEEADLHERFGDEYAKYQNSVRCWIPNLKPYGVENEVQTKV